jgi:glycosyltransferase involved in cell wall biosynthesis
MQPNVHTAALPLVSIALCTFNGEKYLRPQLDSLLAQTYAAIEIVVTDDASTDTTVAILNEYASRHAIMRVFVNAINLGYNKNFEATMRRCNGAFIAVSDQDDIWATDKIATMLAHWNRTAGLLYCSSKKIINESGITNNRQPATAGYTGTAAAPLACVNPVEGHTILFRRSLLEQLLPFPEGIYYDWWMGVVAAGNGGLQWIPQVLVWRRIHENNAYESRVLSAQQKKAEWQQHLQAFLTVKTLDAASSIFIANCLQLLNKAADKKTWYQFIYKNRDTFFYYKMGWFSFWSKIKHSKKKAAELAAS